MITNEMERISDDYQPGVERLRSWRGVFRLFAVISQTPSTILV